jgi:hypothetical protein
MPGRAEKGGRGGGLDDLAVLHDRDAIGEPLHDGQVVAHEQECESRVLELPEKPQDLRLHDRVECGRRLVGHEQPRPAGDRRGDERPLPQSPGQLVRILPRAKCRSRHCRLGQCFNHPLPELDAAHPRLLYFDHLGDLPADAAQRVEGDERILAHEPDTAAPDAAPVPVPEAGGVDTGHHELLGRDPGLRRNEAEQRERGHGLAGAGFSDERQALARRHLEGHARHRLGLRIGEPHAQVANRDVRRAHEFLPALRA